MESLDDTYMEIRGKDRPTATHVKAPSWIEVRNAIDAIDGDSQESVSLHTQNVNFLMRGGVDRLAVICSVTQKNGITIRVAYVVDNLILSEQDRVYMNHPNGEEGQIMLSETIPKKVVYILAKVVFDENRFPLEHLASSYSWVINNTNLYV